MKAPTTNTMNYQLKTRNGKISTIEVPNEKVGYMLQCAYGQQYRIRVWYGDTDSGNAWNDFHDVKGKVSFSNGETPIPILIATSRSHGGGSILTDCIVRIDIIEDKRTMYKHENFHVDFRTDELVAYSERDIKFLKGETYR